MHSLTFPVLEIDNKKKITKLKKPKNSNIRFQKPQQIHCPFCSNTNSFNIKKMRCTSCQTIVNQVKFYEPNEKFTKVGVSTS